MSRFPAQEREVCQNSIIFSYSMILYVNYYHFFLSDQNLNANDIWSMKTSSAAWNNAVNQLEKVKI